VSDDARKYGAEGGKIRAARLSPEQRSEIARSGAIAKWSKEGVVVKTTPMALYGSPDKPLRIGNIEIPCYVLSDGRRVLVQRGLQTGIGFSRSGGKGGARRLVAFMESLERKGIDTRDLASRANSPIKFFPRGGALIAHGYEATILPDICAVIIDADQQGKLAERQRHLAQQCAVLQHGFATVGIIALVDEATGYLEFKRKRDYAEILEKFISKEIRPWARRFPFEFYEKIFHLKGWDASDLTPNSPKPLEVGKITDDLIYKRLAPGVRTELKRLTPRNEKGYLAIKLHQHLTEEIGNPKLEKHIAVVMALMDVSGGWDSFMHNVNKVLPRFGNNYELPLNDSVSVEEFTRGHLSPSSLSSLA
jgi:P63C domain